MKLLSAALIVPTVLVLGIAAFETRIIYPLPSNGPTQGIVWDGSTFPTRMDFARWLRSRGSSYAAWARRHPARAGIATSRAARQPAAQKAQAGNAHRSSWVGEALGAAAAVAALGIGIVFFRRRRRQVSGASLRDPPDVAAREGPTAAERAARVRRRWSATAERCLSLAVAAPFGARRRHGDLAWYLATGLLAAGMGVVLTMWLEGA